MIRVLSSSVALFVKVMASILLKSHGRSITLIRKRLTSVKVFPDPADDL
jgi:hypothetical protein